VFSNERQSETPPGTSTSNCITIRELFARRAEETPDAVAVRADGESMTYAELNAATTQVAALLRARGARRGTFIGLAAERSIDTIIAMLAILKSGAAYVPIDLAAPAARIEAICSDAGVDLIVTSARHAARFGSRAYVPEADDANIDLAAAAGAMDASAPAYVIFTSGSTGVPKGVMVEHAGMINHLFAKIDELRLDEDDVIAQTASQAFDISGMAIRRGVARRRARRSSRRRHRASSASSPPTHRTE
jgi:non-ribosomal peptide synthetase component F